MTGRSSRNPRGLLLRREVEPPQRHHAGVGVMLIASASMFFAVASSAFLLRAQVPAERCHHPHAPQPIAPAPALAPDLQAPAEEAPECGQAVYEERADGTVSVVFDVCDRAIDEAELDLIDVELVDAAGE